MNKRRIFRALVCFLVICCILINCSPIRAKAVVTEALVVTGAGVFATMFAIAMGLVAVDLTVQLINGIGDSMTQHLYQWGSSAEKLDEVESFLTLLPPQFDNDSDDDGGDDGSEDPSANTFVIPTDILDGLIDWAKGLINGEGVEVDGEAAPEGYAYYNGVLISDFTLHSSYPSGCSYHCIVRSNSTGRYYVYCSSSPASYFLDDNEIHFANNYFNSSSWQTDPPITWGFFKEHSAGGSLFVTPVWSNHDLYCDDGTLCMAASEPVYVGTETVTIPNYVGDIPQQVKDGTFDEEAFVLPYINYALPFQGQLDAVSALNNLSTQLMDQTLTYDQYMEQIQTEPSTTPDPDPGTGDNGSGTTPSGPVPDMLPYALDLTDFFPFCIPFDIYDFFSALIAEPEAPKLHWEFQDLSGHTYSLDVDLSPWNGLAATFRSMQLLLFIVGLAVASRKFIKW